MNKFLKNCFANKLTMLANICLRMIYLKSSVIIIAGYFIFAVTKL